MAVTPEELPVDLRDYTELLSTMTVKSSGWSSAFNKIASNIAQYEARYREISEATNGVPWYFIGVIHNLEGGLNFTRHLHNGDTLKKRTVRVPANRPAKGYGPFTFFESAVDALKMKGLHEITDWSVERMCYELERYNGFGYRQYRKINSPYLWSGTNHYAKGKYVADGKWDGNAVSKQAGAVPVLLLLHKGEVQEKIKTPTKSLTKEEVVQKSSKLSLLRNLRNFISFAILSVGGLITTENLLVAKTWMGELVSNFGVGQLATVAGILLAVWVLSKWLEIKSLEDHKQGRYTPSKAE